MLRFDPVWPMDWSINYVRYQYRTSPARYRMLFSIHSHMRKSPWSVFQDGSYWIDDIQRFCTGCTSWHKVCAIRIRITAITKIESCDGSHYRLYSGFLSQNTTTQLWVSQPQWWIFSRSLCPLFSQQPPRGTMPAFPWVWYNEGWDFQQDIYPTHIICSRLAQVMIILSSDKLVEGLQNAYACHLFQ